MGVFEDSLARISAPTARVYRQGFSPRSKARPVRDTVTFKSPCGHDVQIPRSFARIEQNYFSCPECLSSFKFPAIQTEPGPTRNIEVRRACDPRLPDGPGPFDTRR